MRTILILFLGLWGVSVIGQNPLEGEILRPKIEPLETLLPIEISIEHEEYLFSRISLRCSPFLVPVEEIYDLTSWIQVNYISQQKLLRDHSFHGILNIYDAWGLRVASITDRAGIYELDLASFPDGYYLVEIRDFPAPNHRLLDDDGPLNF